MFRILAILGPVLIAQIHELVEASKELAPAPGSASIFNTFLILALGAGLFYLHRDNKNDARIRAEKDDVRFAAHQKHHEEVVGKMDTERAAFNAERATYATTLIALVRDNTAASLKIATALDNLSELLMARNHGNSSP